MSKISIITINYNNKIGLEKTILSVLFQDFLNFEYIIIDGDSNDGSKQVIEKFKDKFTYSLSEPDTGIYNAMNKGIKIAKGDYLLFLNSGDSLINDSNILNTCQKKLKEDIVAFDCFLAKGKQIVGRRSHIEYPTLYYVYKNGFKHQSTFIKKSLFEKIGLYNESYKISGDYEFWVRSFIDSKTTSKSYIMPIVIFQLGGISQNSDWSREHLKVEEEWLKNVIVDFNTIDKLLPFQNSRVLSTIIKFKKLLGQILKK